MNGLGAALLAGRDDLLDHQIALRRSGWTDQDGLIRHLDVESVFIGLRVNGDRFDAHFAGRLDDPAGDFAAIGNQNTLEHAALRGMPSPNREKAADTGPVTLLSRRQSIQRNLTT